MTTGSPTRPRSAMVTLTKYSTKASALSSRSQTLIYNTAPLLCSIRAFQWGQTFLFFFFLKLFFSFFFFCRRTDLQVAQICQAHFRRTVGGQLRRLRGLCAYIAKQTKTPESFPAVCYTLQDSLHMAVSLGGLTNDMPVAMKVSLKKKLKKKKKKIAAWPQQQCENKRNMKRRKRSQSYNDPVRNNRVQRAVGGAFPWPWMCSVCWHVRVKNCRLAAECWHCEDTGKKCLAPLIHGPHANAAKAVWGAPFLLQSTGEKADKASLNSISHWPQRSSDCSYRGTLKVPM